MRESQFQKKVTTWCRQHLRQKLASDHRLSVESSQKITTGWTPWSKENASGDWHWKAFDRELDVVIGLNITVEGAEMLLPLIVFELKTSDRLTTDELDKKSAIYGPLRELYPWIHTIFIHCDIHRRGMGFDYLYRNARQFDAIFTEWENKETRALLGKLIDYQLEYLLEYWEF